MITTYKICFHVIFPEIDESAKRKSLKIVKQMKAGLGGFGVYKPIRHRNSLQVGLDLTPPKPGSVELQNAGMVSIYYVHITYFNVSETNYS